MTLLHEFIRDISAWCYTITLVKVPQADTTRIIISNTPTLNIRVFRNSRLIRQVQQSKLKNDS